MSVRLVLLGVGRVARAVAAHASSDEILGTTRREERANELRAARIEPVVAYALEPAHVRALATNARVLVSFPPDGETDERIAPACAGARSIVYISSTAVYGATRGRVDDGTPVAPTDERGRARLEAEAVWRRSGAIVLRSPGIYGPNEGLHVRLAEGSYRLPGDGSGVVSRIHLDDLAQLAAAALERGRAGETYVVGDAEPVPQREVVVWLAERLGLPSPPSVPVETAPPSLRGDRSVDGSRALAELGVTLLYPSYREGFAACLGANEAERRQS